MSIMPCPHGKKCLLLRKDFDRSCKICRLCRIGHPEEYAVQVGYGDSQSMVCGLHEITSPGLPDDISRVDIYHLAGKRYYMKRAFSYAPKGPDGRKQINTQIANFFYGEDWGRKFLPNCLCNRKAMVWVVLFVVSWISGAIILFV